MPSSDKATPFYTAQKTVMDEAVQAAEADFVVDRGTTKN